MYSQSGPNVGNQTIHGASGVVCFCVLCTAFFIHSLWNRVKNRARLASLQWQLALPWPYCRPMNKMDWVIVPVTQERQFSMAWNMRKTYTEITLPCVLSQKAVWVAHHSWAEVNGTRHQGHPKSQSFIVILIVEMAQHGHILGYISPPGSSLHVSYIFTTT